MACFFKLSKYKKKWGPLSGKIGGKKNARPEQNGNNKKNIEAPSHNSYLTFDDNCSLNISRNQFELLFYIKSADFGN